MSMNNHLSQEDLALFALQLLEEPELTNALNHLEECEDCRHDVAKYQGDLVGYALAQSEMHTPPAASRDRLLKRVAKEKKIVPMPVAAPAPVAVAAPAPVVAAPVSSVSTPVAAPAPVAPVAAAPQASAPRASDGELFLASRGRRVFEPEHVEEEEEVRPRSNAAPALAWAGWAIAAGLAVTAGLQWRERQNLQSDFTAMSAKLDSANGSLTDAQAALTTLTDQGAMQVALHVPPSGAPEPPKPEGHVAYNATTGGLVFIGEHLAPVPYGKTYELWLIQPDANGVKMPPIPAGTFKPDDRGIAHLMMPELPKGTAAAAFGVTVEQDGGSSKPTLPIVLAGL